MVKVIYGLQRFVNQVFQMMDDDFTKRVEFITPLSDKVGYFGEIAGYGEAQKRVVMMIRGKAMSVATGYSS